jgi:hypothetical protein
MTKEARRALALAGYGGLSALSFLVAIPQLFVCNSACL